ncbi:MAG: PspC domain-containing protein [Geodermatophilaceae bacterium]|nr:PspC domain-containing protein [Geodermatophilaceae bacterium]
MLRRSNNTRLLGGVSGGLSEHTGIDVLLFRVGFVVLTIAGGAGLLLYLALWLLLPDAYGEPSSAQRWLARRPTSTARNIILVVAGLFVLAVILDDVGADSGVIAILAVAALAYMWTRDRDRHEQPNVPADAAVSQPEGGAGVVTAVQRRPIRPPRQRSVLGRLTISVLLISLGILALIDRQTDFDLSTSGYLAVALGIVGGGLLVGTFWGRSRGLIVLGVPLVVLLCMASTFDVSLRNGVGERYWQPSSADAIESSYRYGIGQAELDLSTVDFEDADAGTTIRAGIGYVHIIVPADVDVRVTADVRTGSLTLFDVRTEASSDVRRTVTDTGADGPGGGQLDLAVDLGLGLVEVTRVG